MLLGIDLGTGSVKALLLDLEGETLAQGRADYAVEAPRPGWAETEPRAWWSATVQAVRQALKGRASEVSAIGLAGQMHGVVLVDARGEPLRRAILWADGRSATQVRAYGRLAPEQRRRLANPAASGMAGPTLLWLKEHEPSTYDRAGWALQPKDWLRWRLTGLAAAEPSDASATLLYDVRADLWAEDVVEALGLRRAMLAPLVPSGSVAGALTSAAARELGLRQGLPVAAGGADVAAAALGTGLVAPGELQLTVGSGAQLLALTADYQADDTGRSHLFRSAMPRGYYALAAMQNAGLALEWVRRSLGVSWVRMYEEAFSVPAGADGVVFLPYLTGERTPHFDPGAGGSWSGLKLHHTRAHLLRAAFEGVAFSLRDGLGVLQDLGHDAGRLRLAGGGSLEPAWRQLLADVLGRPLHAVAVPAASARGAALLAGLATGKVAGFERVAALAPATGPVALPAGAHPALEDAYRRFRGLYPALRAVTPDGPMT